MFHAKALRNVYSNTRYFTLLMWWMMSQAVVFTHPFSLNFITTRRVHDTVKHQEGMNRYGLWVAGDNSYELLTVAIFSKMTFFWKKDDRLKGILPLSEDWDSIRLRIYSGKLPICIDFVFLESHIACFQGFHTACVGWENNT